MRAPPPPSAFGAPPPPSAVVDAPEAAVAVLDLSL